MTSDNRTTSKRPLSGVVLPAMVLATALAASACAVRRPAPAIDDSANLSAEDRQLRHKFRGIYGGVLRIDAASRKERVTITSETGSYIASPSLLGPGGGANLTYAGRSMPVPKAVHVTWREGDVTYQYSSARWTGGTIIGDYTVPVAERIPDEILDYIRRNGGALRVKIRLIDDGVLIGWDVEERVPLKTPGAGNYLRYTLPGGDFKEARPAQPIWDGHRFISLPSSMPLPLSAENEAILEKYRLMLVGKEGGIRTIPPTPSNYRRVWEKGWYIDKHTGQKIETDY